MPPVLKRSKGVCILFSFSFNGISTSLVVLASPELEVIFTLSYLGVDLPLKMKVLSSSVELSHILQKMGMSVHCAQNLLLKYRNAYYSILVKQTHTQAYRLTDTSLISGVELVV